MKKLLAFLFCISVLAIMTVSAAENITYVFDSEEKVAEWVSSYNNKATEYSFDAEHGYLKVTNTGTDPFITHSFSQPIDAAEYTAVLYRYKIIDGYKDNLKGQLFYATDTTGMGKNGSYMNFNLQGSDDWQEAIIDFSSKETWNGKITSFRFDPVDGEPSKVTILVHSITFAPTKKEAMIALSAFESENNNSTPLELVFDKFSATAEVNLQGISQSFENGEWILHTTGNDPMMYFNINESNAIQCDAHPYLAFRMKAKTTATSGGIFFTSNASPAMGKNHSKFQLLNNDGEWAEYIIDMRMYEHGNWYGKLTALRIDPINNIVDPEGIVQIDRFGIFKTQEEAVAFLEKEVTLNVIENDFEEDVSQVINSGAETPKWDMRTDDAQMWHTNGGDGGEKAGFYHAYATTNDMFIMNYFDEEDYFDGKEFHYFAMRYKTNTTAGNGALFFSNSEFTSFTSDAYVSFSLDTDGEWHNFIFDLNTTKHKDTWAKSPIRGIRFDPLNPSEIGLDFTFSRLGFFRSRTEALEYLNGATDEEDYSRPTKFRRDYQTVTVPGGVLSTGYDENDYIIAGLDGNVPENAVVSFTDKSGAESIVALGHVNPKGYTTYIARKPGSYKITSSAKDYVDTDGHWGEGYIDYVSSRKLFGGTSETEFSPEDAMTRGMFITVLGRMHGLDISAYDGNTGYSDVPVTEYYAPYIQWAKEFSIMTPVSDTVFGADTPILRKDMASAIANYVNAYGYTINSVDTPVEFNDISSLTEAEKAAVVSAQTAGIINGKGDGKFDPAGISTRAEVATVMQRVIKGILGVNVPATSYSPDYYSRDRLRIGVWAFPRQLINDAGVKQLSELGADLIISGGNPDLLNYTDKYGIEIMLNHLPFTKSAYDTNYNYGSETARYAEHPSYGGNYMVDEPGTDDFAWLGELAKRYNEKVPDKTPFINLLPMYANAAQLKMGASAAAIEYYDSDPELYRKYCQAWFENFDVDYICTDIYPLTWSGSKKVTRKEYVEYINQIATVARENDADFWCCIQTFGWTSSRRTPNEAEYRWQSYAMLSFGCTGILLWNYTGYSDYPSLIDMNTVTPTQAYYDCKNVMWELRAISDTYIKYKNLGAYTVNCTEKTDYLAMTGEYKDFTTIKSLECKDPLLVGCFTAKEGDSKAFTITNMLDFQGNEDKTTAVSFV
ncbi:MAG: S-layer homology domain-containing protein, partial [Clostridia bacterium]|nr:S-layer homology domain-containing protein [Clostridia bacterium]